MESEREARRWVFSGQVQGVGFRPFVYRLAHRLGLSGWVRNAHGQVEVEAQGERHVLEEFGAAIVGEAPAIARPRIDRCEGIVPGALEGFRIRRSVSGGKARVHLPPDYFTCTDCLRELKDPADRRYRYPFINCTQCGPRYTIIRALPYDRPNTTMSGFPLCRDCAQEYADPLDRRFHAEPVACPACGPSVGFVRGEMHIDDTQAAIAAAVEALRCGQVVAVRGVGGYHLMCDATDDAAIQALRQRKPRPHKPLAVMFPERGGDGVAALRNDVRLDAAVEDLLRSPQRPIVLAGRRDGSRLSQAIAPGLAEIGAMLPYSPLHHLLLEGLGGPLVATSGNISGEPVLTDAREAARRLAHIADAFLHHDRPIQRPADDSVFRPVAGDLRPIRMGRGAAPLELELSGVLDKPLLAVGGHLKNTVALAWDDRIVVSPHIGDMGTARSMRVFVDVVEDLQSIYGVRARAVACDAHPDYDTARWARDCGLPVLPVFHHHAHASALYEEQRGEGDWLVFAWDGTGYGEDGTIWGGETFHGRPGRWRRVASFRPLHLVGGDRAGREPWRSAAALAWAMGREWAGLPDPTGLAHQAWKKRINCPRSSAVGRLFDAAAAFVLGITHTSYEGQGAMQLEALADGNGPVAPGAGGVLECELNLQGGLLVVDWGPLVAFLQDESVPVALRARGFHAALGLAIRDQVRRLRDTHAFSRVGLTGGVFQNRVLSAMAVDLLAGEGVGVSLSRVIPCNDGGISFGQAVECLGRSPTCS